MTRKFKIRVFTQRLPIVGSENYVELEQLTNEEINQYLTAYAAKFRAKAKRARSKSKFK